MHLYVLKCACHVYYSFGSRLSSGVSTLGAGGAPPDPDDAVVQKAQYICTSRQNIYICKVA